MEELVRDETEHGVLVPFARPKREAVDAENGGVPVLEPAPSARVHVANERVVCVRRGAPEGDLLFDDPLRVADELPHVELAAARDDDPMLSPLNGEARFLERSAFDRRIRELVVIGSSEARGLPFHWRQ